MFRRISTLVLAYSLSSSPAFAAAAWVQGDCNVKTTAPGHPSESTGSALLDANSDVSLCPTDTTPSQALQVSCDSFCSWDDGASAVTLTITDARNSNERWTVPPDVSCGPATVGACSEFSLEAGERVTVTQGGASAAGTLWCWQRGECK